MAKRRIFGQSFQKFENTKTKKEGCQFWGSNIWFNDIERKNL